MTQTTTFDFDEAVDRRGTGSAKWDMVDLDVIPMPVADMDFRAPPAVINALHETVEHGVFGYNMPPEDLNAVIRQRLYDRYGWGVQPEDVLYVPSGVSALNIVARSFLKSGDGILTQTPVYFPFYATATWNDAVTHDAPLKYVDEGDAFTHEIDWDAFEGAINNKTRMFLFCNPHNPVGRVFRREELQQMAAIAEEHKLLICSDEIHSDLLMPGHEHIPMAMISPEAAARTVTMFAPSKTFNVPGLSFAVLIVQNPELREHLIKANDGLFFFKPPHGPVVSKVNMLGRVAALAAYQHGDPWLRELLAYLEGNRDTVVQFLAEHMPGIKPAKLEGTYLMWLDCRALDLPEEAAEWFHAHARVFFSDGLIFGEAGRGFVRMNIATNRSTLVTALERMRDALSARL